MCFLGMKTTGTKAELLMRLQNSGNGAIDNTITTIKNDNSNLNLDINSNNNVDNNNSNSNSNSDSNNDKITHSKMTIKNLQVLCREKKLPVSGSKQSIIDRLVQYDLDNNVNNDVSNNINMIGNLSPSNIQIEKENDYKSDDNNNDSNDSNEKNSMYTIYNNMDKKSLIDICMSKCLSSSGSKEQLIDTLMRDDMAANDTVTTEESFVQCFNEGLRKEIPLYTIQPPVKKYREIR